MVAAERFHLLSVISKVLIVALFGIIVALVVRGTATGTLVVPTSSNSNPVCVLIADTDRSRSVHCAVRIKSPVSKVAAAISDFSSYPRIFNSPFWWVATATSSQSPAGTILEGVFSTHIFSFPFKSTVVFHEEPTTWRATWNQADGPLVRNRGSWTLTAQESETLVEYKLDVGVSGYPDFLVRNCLLVGLPVMMSSLKAYVEQM